MNKPTVSSEFPYRVRTQMYTLASRFMCCMCTLPYLPYLPRYCALPCVTSSQGQPGPLLTLAYLTHATPSPYPTYQPCYTCTTTRVVYVMVPPSPSFLIKGSTSTPQAGPPPSANLKYLTTWNGLPAGFRGSCCSGCQARQTKGRSQSQHYQANGMGWDGMG